MIDLTHVSDENVIEIFNVTFELIEGLSGGFNQPEVFDRAVELELSCLNALRKGSDNLQLADELEAKMKDCWHRLNRFTR